MTHGISKNSKVPKFTIKVKMSDFFDEKGCKLRNTENNLNDQSDKKPDFQSNEDSHSKMNKEII